MPHAVVEVSPISGGITNTKWILRLTEGEPLVLRWSDPAVWGAVGREHVRRPDLTARDIRHGLEDLLAATLGQVPARRDRTRSDEFRR